jgi:guanylate kinase
LCLGFSISATSRAPRGEEQHGVDYYFLSNEEFALAVEAGRFVEWEEVYPGCRYGTLISEVERVTGNGNLIMDVDVKGALSVKKAYPSDALSIFIMPPDLKTLEQRLRGRATDSEESIRKRVSKAEYEITFAPQFDAVVVNDNLEKAVADVRRLIYDFCEVSDR